MGTIVEHEPAVQLWTLLRDRAFASLKDDFTARVAECSLSLPQGKLIRELARPESRSEEHTSELQSQSNLVCRLLLEKKKNKRTQNFGIGRSCGGHTCATRTPRQGLAQPCSH